MKIFLTTFLLGATALIATADDAATVTGKWKIHISIASREADASCTITQTGDELKGTCEAPGGTVNLSGKVEGKKVSWSYKTSSEAGPITLNYRGAINSPTSMEGAVSVEEFGVEGQFTATPAS